MRRSRVLSWVVLELFLLQATGCFSYRPLESPLPTTWSRGMEGPTVRVTMEDGQRWRLKDASMDSLTVQGRQISGEEKERVVIPLSTVRSIDEKHFSLKKTVILGLVGWVLLDAFLIATRDIRGPTGAGGRP